MTRNAICCLKYGRIYPRSDARGTQWRSASHLNVPGLQLRNKMVSTVLQHRTLHFLISSRPSGQWSYCLDCECSSGEQLVGARGIQQVQKLRDKVKYLHMQSIEVMERSKCSNDKYYKCLFEVWVRDWEPMTWMWLYQIPIICFTTCLE